MSAPIPVRWRVEATFIGTLITVAELPGILEEARGRGAAWIKVGVDGVPEALIVEWIEDADFDAFDIAEALGELRDNHPELRLAIRPEKVTS